jgi:hypothetical protein
MLSNLSNGLHRHFKMLGGTYISGNCCKWALAHSKMCLFELSKEQHVKCWTVNPFC